MTNAHPVHSETAWLEYAQEIGDPKNTKGLLLYGPFLGSVFFNLSLIISIEADANCMP